MEKKIIIRFLEQRRRGVYTLIVEMYAEVVVSMGAKMALEFIKEDLEKNSGAVVDLQYFSLARAIKRFKKRAAIQPEVGSGQKWKFRDSSEIKESQLSPGKFKLG